MNRNGSSFVKVDLHLHTKSDKEFLTTIDDMENFAQKYVQKLKAAEIRVGAITNHNHFNREEYLMLKKKAAEKDILLLPGVELSLSEGKRGLHLLCIFSPEMADVSEGESQSSIELLLTLLFNGEPKFDKQKYPLACKFSLREVISRLDRFQPYIGVLAHVDNSKGYFKEVGFPLIKEHSKDQFFKNKILAFQGINKSSRNKFENELTSISRELNINKELLKPAYIEASDPKSLEQVGRKFTYVKLGELSFQSLKFALSHPKLRVRDMTSPTWTHPYIEQIKFVSEKSLKGVQFSLNPDLNNMIGIRGAGKSTIIEAIRYVLDIHPVADKDYKEELIKYSLGSGGKITMKLFINGQSYMIERILGEKSKVYRDDEFVPYLQPTDVFPIIYFGQKDLQKHVEDSQLRIRLIDQYIEENLTKVKVSISEVHDEIKMILRRIKELSEKITRKDEIVQRQAKVEEQIQIFERLNIAEKLHLEANYKKDELIFDRIKRLLDNQKEVHAKSLIDINDLFSEYPFYQSKENKDLLENLEEEFRSYQQGTQQIFANWNLVLKGMLDSYNQLKNQFENRKENISEELAQLKRECQLDDVSPDDYVRLIQEREQYKVAINEFEKYEKQLKELKKIRLEKYQQLQQLWFEEFQLRTEKTQEVNQEQNLIEMNILYKEDKEEFFNLVLTIMRGTGIRQDKLRTLVEEFADGIEIVKSLSDLARLEFLSFTKLELNNFLKRVEEQEEILVLNRIPDTVNIKYQGKYLEHLSLGQRASALILLLLSLGDKPIIMDQPEDDLDNQTIYEGLVRELLDLKGKRQIVFATHNSNIPVLGDCEQVVVSQQEANQIKVITGSIDNLEIQKDIVKIMEGGSEAFEKRKEIYNQWII